MKTVKFRKFRRYYLDRALSVTEFRGRVLDVGGKKVNKRGTFAPPLGKVDSWEYLNIDASTKPDYACSADHIPVENSRFDMVLMTEVLEHLEDTEAVLKELFRVLKDDGVVIASIPFLSAMHIHTLDFQRWTAKKVRNEFERAGFHIETIEPMGGVVSVVTDLVLTYTFHNPSFINRKVIEKLTRFFSPLLLYLDKKTKSRDRITTGFFIRARKSRT